MLLKTSNGNTYNVDWIDTINTGTLYMQMMDERALSVIAAEFEGLSWLKRESENQGDKLFEGYSALTMVRQADPGVVLMTFEKGADANGGTD